MKPKTYILRLAPFALCLGLFACGGYEDRDGSSGGSNNGDPNNGAPNNGDPNNGGANNGGANNGGANNGDNNGEVELPPCEDNVDCRGGEVCREGLCREACAVDDPCAGPLPQCDVARGYCVGCLGDQDCGNNQRCQEGQCSFYCLSDAACGEDEYCDDNGQCQKAECGDDADCPGGFRCAGGLCVSIEGLACEPGEQRCDGDVAVRCSRDGAREEVEACSPEPCVLDGDVARCGELPEQICQPGKAECQGNTALICNPAGTGFLGDGQACGALGLICQEGACVAPDVDCPTAIARARVQGTATWRQDLEVAIGDVVELDSSQSIGAQRVAWSLIERPEGSAARLTPANNNPSPRITVDVAGRYVIDLEVFDAEGAESCQRARVILGALSDERGIRLQLTWDTPADSNQADDNGSDLDLHLLHPSGRWGAAPWDCYWQNNAPDWGVSGPRQNPSLDIDDANGAGPENISYDDPENRSYRVGVLYYEDRGFGDSTATVSIWLNGALVRTQTRALTARDQFWEVARIDWDQTPSTAAINVVTNGFPSNTPAPECAVNADCPQGERCSQGVCIPANVNCTDALEPNNQAGQESIITPGTYANLSLCPGDEDWFRFNNALLSIVNITYSPSNAPVTLNISGDLVGGGGDFQGSNGSIQAFGFLSLTGSFNGRLTTTSGEPVSYTMTVSTSQ